MLKIKRGSSTLVKIGQRGYRFTESLKQRIDSSCSIAVRLNKEEKLTLVIW